jgi:hypothetical protein
MYLDVSREELIALRTQLRKKLKYFSSRPAEWAFWKKTENLDELYEVFKRIDRHLQESVAD